ncbi:hypothetical protein MLD38_038988 [Melastoma candidum]|uniref:Uncharacterized protein n=1 Tax=Melastoma candidum TaxID=119954 RepID=A0ACB9L2Z2_9MYRT|nr:hypothetical protein MLD38_038988 [Melastoma candidum]
MKSHPFTCQEAERFFLHLLHKSPCPSRPHVRQLHRFLFRHCIYVSNLILSRFAACFSGNVDGIPYACRIFNFACNPNVLPVKSLIKFHSLHPEHACGLFAFYDVMRARLWIGGVELYAAYGEMANAQETLKEMNGRDSAVVCNILVNGIFKAGDVGTVGAVRQWIRGEEGFSMDEATMVSIFPDFAKLGDVAIVPGWSTEKEGILKEFQTARNDVIDFYCNSGNVEKAFKFFRSMSEQNEATWNAMSTGMAYNGRNS